MWVHPVITDVSAKRFSTVLRQLFDWRLARICAGIIATAAAGNSSLAAARQVAEYSPDLAPRRWPKLGNLGVEDRHPGEGLPTTPGRRSGSGRRIDTGLWAADGMPRFVLERQHQSMRGAAVVPRAGTQVLRSETSPDRSASSTSLARFWFWARSSTPNLWNKVRRWVLTPSTLR